MMGIKWRGAATIMVKTQQLAHFVLTGAFHGQKCCLDNLRGWQLWFDPPFAAIDNFRLGTAVGAAIIVIANDANLQIDAGGILAYKYRELIAIVYIANDGFDGFAAMGIF